MLYLKDIVNQIEDLSNMSSIVGASEEIASMKMRGIRGQVLLSRDINSELTEIYREVSISYRHQIVHLLSHTKDLNVAAKKNFALKKGNGQKACVFLSANSGFFSKILERTYDSFVQYLETHDDVPVIIGEFGKRLFTNQFPNREFIFFPFVEGQNQEENFKKITQDLAAYQNVIIFYARFESMSSQTVSSLDVSGLEQTSDSQAASSIHYLFEPSLEKIIEFFESEIFAGIIHQTVTESELARYASRITTLDIARENINTKLKTINLQKRFAAHRIMNKKQTEAISGITLWKLA